MLAENVPVAKLEAYEALKHAIEQEPGRRLTKISQTSRLTALAIAFCFYLAPRADSPRLAAIALLILIAVIAVLGWVAIALMLVARRRLAQSKWTTEDHEEASFESLSVAQRQVADAAFRCLPRNMHLRSKRYFVNGRLTHLLLVVIHGQEEACLGAWHMVNAETAIELKMLSKTDYIATTNLADRLGSKGVRLASMRSTLKLQAAWERTAQDLARRRGNRAYTIAAVLGLSSLDFFDYARASDVLTFVSLRAFWIALVVWVIGLNRRSSRPVAWVTSPYEGPGTPPEALSELRDVQPILERKERLVVRQLHDRRVAGPSIVFVADGAHEWPLISWCESMPLELASASGF
jgi:hypothetical protein